MLPWLESLAILSLLLLTGLCLPLLARARGWSSLWLAVLITIGLLGALRRWPTLEATPIGCLTAGRTEYALYGPLTLLLLGLPGLCCPRLLLKLLTAIMALLVCWSECLTPFLGPVLYSPPKGHLNKDGICRQDDGFSCGPAAAVTALGRLGITADFSSLASAAHTSPAIGTPPDLLCGAISSLYPVQARLVYPDNLDQLPPGVSLLVMNLDTWVDHYVALLQVDTTQVEVGDPLGGRKTVLRSEFEPNWRHLAVVLQPR